jgi:transposase-like protein
VDEEKGRHTLLGCWEGLEDGYPERAESWRAVLRDLKRRGMRGPVLATGDGALGFWAAVREVCPETAEQRCWVHRIANVVDTLPKRLQPRAKPALHAMLYTTREPRASGRSASPRSTVVKSNETVVIGNL